MKLFDNYLQLILEYEQNKLKEIKSDNEHHVPPLINNKF